MRMKITCKACGYFGPYADSIETLPASPAGPAIEFVRCGRCGAAHAVVEMGPRWEPCELVKPERLRLGGCAVAH
jgi:hypothetical protein